MDPEPGVAVHVGAVIVTYRRTSVLLETLDAVVGQTLAPASVVVVDNASASELRDLVDERYPGVTYVPSDGNVGYGAGLAIGMRKLTSTTDPAFYWLLDDDSPPSKDALSRALELALARPDVGVVATRGGEIRFGAPRYVVPARSSFARAQFGLIDGALVSRRAVDATGYPREDLFMMYEDIEYTTRIKAAHLEILVRQPDESRFLHLGSGGTWRNYYQTRNQLRVALDRRSANELIGWALRNGRLFATLLVRRDWRQISLRWRGVVHAVRGRMGRTVEPS